MVFSDFFSVLFFPYQSVFFLDFLFFSLGSFGLLLLHLYGYDHISIYEKFEVDEELYINFFS